MGAGQGNSSHSMLKARSAALRSPTTDALARLLNVGSLTGYRNTLPRRLRLLRLQSRQSYATPLQRATLAGALPDRPGHSCKDAPPTRQRATPPPPPPPASRRLMALAGHGLLRPGGRALASYAAQGLRWVRSWAGGEHFFAWLVRGTSS